MAFSLHFGSRLSLGESEIWIECRSVRKHEYGTWSILSAGLLLYLWFRWSVHGEAI